VRVSDRSAKWNVKRGLIRLWVMYDALCAKLRAQKAAGGRVDPIPAMSALEPVVSNGVGRVVVAPGRCLVVASNRLNSQTRPGIAFTKQLSGNLQRVQRHRTAALGRPTQVDSLACVLSRLPPKN